MAGERGAFGGWRGALSRLFGVTTMPTQKVQGGATVVGDPDVLAGQINPPPLSQTRWLLTDLERAIHQCDLGDLSIAGRLWRSMRRDGVLAGVLSTRTDGLVRLPIRWSGDDEMVRTWEGRDRKRGLFAQMFPAPELALLAADGIGLGVGVGEMLPLPTFDEDEPPAFVFRHLEPEFLRYRWHEDRWYFNSIAGPLPIIPGVQREDGGWWVLHRPGGEMTPWAHGLWASLGRAYIAKEHAMLHRENYSAKLAQAARAAISPAGATEDQRRGFLARLIAWGVNQTFDLPPGWDVKLIESNGRGYDVFQATIDTSNEEYVVSLAGQTVTTDGGSGFANAEIHKTIRADLIQSTADGVALTVNEQGILPYTNLRWGAGALESAAEMEWDTSPPKEMKAQADSLLQFGLAVRSLNEALKPYGHRVDVHEMTTRFGVPIAGDEEPVVQPRETSPEGDEETGPAEDAGTPAPPAAPKIVEPGPGTGNGERFAAKRRTVEAVARYDWHGLSIVVENPKGSMRRWFDSEANEVGSTLMLHDYGFIAGHLGADGDDLDCYVGPASDARYVYVVHQLKAPTFEAFDEDKVMLGFATSELARQAYLEHRNDGDRAFGGMSVIRLEDFLKKIDRRSGSGRIHATRTAELEQTRLGRHGFRARQIQAVAFDRDDWELSEAKAWARAHELEVADVEIHGNEIVLVASTSTGFVTSSLERVDLGDGVEAIVGRAKGVA